MTKTQIEIDYTNFTVIARSPSDTLRRAEVIDRLARMTAAFVAFDEGLPHYTLDCKIGNFYEYRENIAAENPT